MAIDINKIVEEALAKTTDLETLTEDTNKDIDKDTDKDTDVSADEIKMFEELSAINNIALSTAFAAGLGALSLRHNLKNIKEDIKVKKPMSMKKKIGLGIGAGLAAGAAGAAAYKNKNEIIDVAKNAYKNKDKLVDMAKHAGKVIKKSASNLISK